MARKIFYVYYSYETGALTSGVRIEGHGSLGTKTKICATSVDMSSFDPMVRIVESGFGRGGIFGHFREGRNGQTTIQKRRFLEFDFWAGLGSKETAWRSKLVRFPHYYHCF